MKVTIYELLGMVKNGKAPKKIRYREMIYHINYEYGDYESDIEEYRFVDVKEHYYLFEDIDMLKCLDDKVEILEEEKKIPEKLPIYDCVDAYSKFDITDNRKAINEIIDYLKSKGE